jgi:hypothetical protein
MPNMPERLRRTFLTAALSAFVLGAWQGCGSDSGKPEVAPVKGTVTYKGKPVEEAMIEFCQEGLPFRSTGLTNEAGKFEVTSIMPGDGAPVGKNKVTVTIRPILLDPRAGSGIDMAALEKIEDPEERRRKSIEMESKALANYRSSLGLKPAPAHQSLPKKYSSRDSTDIELDVVPDQQNEFEIVLTD